MEGGEGVRRKENTSFTLQWIQKLLNLFPQDTYFTDTMPYSIFLSNLNNYLSIWIKKTIKMNHEPKFTITELLLALFLVV